MKTKMIILVAIVFLVSSFAIKNAIADDPIRSTGIGVRGTYWNFENTSNKIKIIEYGRESTISWGGTGGWLYLLSRIDNNAFMELSMGAVGKVKEANENWTTKEVEAEAIAAILIGLRYELLQYDTRNALRPYLSFGAGPYWVTQVTAREKIMDEEVSITSDATRGGYLGGGLNFRLTNWMALNFDMKYHFINFDVKHEHSGFEYGLGVQFMWGHFSK